VSRLLVDLDEAAQQLSVSRRSVQSLIYDGALLSVTVGRRRLIALVDLEAYVHELRSGGSDPVHVSAKTKTTDRSKPVVSKEVRTGASSPARHRTK
jgi:excisionase family DNA binding protein